jgi:hypothetical protein
MTEVMEKKQEKCGTISYNTYHAPNKLRETPSPTSSYSATAAMRFS